ncbi:MAG: glycosyltransferase family 39 protein [Acidobacteriota bacterium]
MKPARGNAALFAAALAVRLAGIGRENFWIDEVNTVTVSRGSPLHVLERMRLFGESHPPLYYFLLSAWMTIAGEGDTAVRVLSAILGALAVPLAVSIAREMAPEAGLFAGVLAVLAPGMIQYSQEARMYALLTALAGGVLLLWLRGAPVLREKVVLAILTTLLLLTHHVGLFFGAALGVLGLALPGKRLARALPLLAGLALYSPWLAVLARQWATTRRFFTWNVVRSPLVELLRIGPATFLGDAAEHRIAGRIAQGLVAVAALAGLAVLARADRAKAARLGGALALPPLMVLAFSALPSSASLLHRRYFCFLAVGAVALPAMACARRAAGIALLAALAVSFGALDVARLVHREHLDARGIAAFLDGELGAGDPVLHASIEGIPQEAFLLCRHYRPGWRHVLVARAGQAFSLETSGYVGSATVYPDLAAALHHEGEGRRRVAVVFSGMLGPASVSAVATPRPEIPPGWRIRTEHPLYRADVLVLERGPDGG